MTKLRLSVLDQSPVSTGSTPAQALQNSVALARHVESLGFHRFWMSEHHAMNTLAGSAPEIMLARIGAETSSIRLGSGGIMLPHYTALKVAETFQTLEALYTGRIDLGVGRAPGGGPVEATALRRYRNATRLDMQTDDFPDQLSELIAFLHRRFPQQHPFSRIEVSPASGDVPKVWLLGSSMWSAEAAAQFGLPYAFAHFFSGESTRAAIQHYQSAFAPNADLGTTAGSHPEAIAAVGVVCARTDQEAARLAQSVRLLQLRIRVNDRRPVATPEEAAVELVQFGSPPPDVGEFPRVFVGTPAKVREGLENMAAQLKIEELMVNTIVHDHEARLRSYSLLAEAFDLHPADSGPCAGDSRQPVDLTPVSS